jgi:SAM-dependent methyltransferase
VTAPSPTHSDDGWQSVLAVVRAAAPAKIVVSERRPKSDCHWDDAAHGPCRKLDVRRVDLAAGPQWQFTLWFRDRTVHRNLTPPAAAKALRRLFPGVFRQLRMNTPDETITLHARPDGSGVRTRRQSHGGSSAAAGQIPNSGPGLPIATDFSHNRAKSHLLPEGTPAPFLVETGVMTAEGQVRRSQTAKFRQINRYLEFMQDVRDSLPADRPLGVVDFGCGKSHLTFAAHWLMTTGWRRPVRMVGLDRKSDVMTECQSLADRIGAEGLSFAVGDLTEYMPGFPVDMAISLHACDTATDAALAAAVRWGCRVVFAVPCCQHEVAARLSTGAVPGLSRFGLLRQRLASDATDALRSLWLEAAGYRTQVLEFIELEHTPKNLLIRAVRDERMPAQVRETAAAEMQSLLRQLGLTDWTLLRMAGDPRAVNP